MKFSKLIVLQLLLFIFLSSCSSLKEAGQAIRNEKSKNSDEFLIQKREPLILPPDYEKILEPDSVQKNETDQNKIKEMLNVKNPKSKSKSNKSSSTEKSILQKIKK